MHEGINRRYLSQLYERAGVAHEEGEIERVAGYMGDYIEGAMMVIRNELGDELVRLGLLEDRSLLDLRRLLSADEQAYLVGAAHDYQLAAGGPVASTAAPAEAPKRKLTINDVDEETRRRVTEQEVRELMREGMSRSAAEREVELRHEGIKNAKSLDELLGPNWREEELARRRANQERAKEKKKRPWWR